MKLIDGKIFDRVNPQIVIEYLKNLDSKIIKVATTILLKNFFKFYTLLFCLRG